MRKSWSYIALDSLFIGKWHSGSVPFLSKNTLTLRLVPGAFLVGCLIFLLIACSPGASPTRPNAASPHASVTRTGQRQPTPTTLAKGTVLYQADWSHGLSGWQASQGWKVAQGQLQADSLTDSSIIAPYQSTVPDYAVETRIQIVRVLKNVVNYFNIFANKA